MKTSQIIKIAIAILLLVVVIGFVVTLPRCKPVQQPEPEEPLAVTNYTQRLAAERMEDKEYMAGLQGYQKRQTEAAVRRSALVAEYNEWRKGFMATNEEVRALLASEAAVATNAVAAAALRDKVEAIIAKDPDGAAFIARRDAIDADIQALQGEIKAYIGDRIRRQVAEHGGEEAAAARKYAATHEGSMPLPTNAAPHRVGGGKGGAGAADNR